MRDYITAEIERRRAELATLDQQRLVLTAQLSLLEEMLAHATNVSGPSHQAQSHSDGRGSDKGRLSKRWMPVLIEAVRRHPRTVRGEEVPGIQKAAGEDPANPPNVRSHFWTNSQPGKFYERVAAGEYRATELAAEVAGIPLGSGVVENSNGASPEPAPSSSESRDEPRSDPNARLDLLNINKAAMPGGGT